MNKLIYRTESHARVEVETEEVYWFPQDLLEVYAWGDAKIGYKEEERSGSFEDCLHNFKLPKEAPNLHTDLSCLFRDAHKFDQSISNFDTSNVTHMDHMFYGAKSFNRSVKVFDTSNVIRMDGLFSNARAFDQSVSSFDTSNVTHMNHMFYGAHSFNRSVENFDTSNVTHMNRMFQDAKAFNQR